MTHFDLPKPQHFYLSKIAFLKSAPSLAQSPDDKGIEVAFVGRSNSGKSSAINAICGKDKLARTSKTPGRTQLINYFEIDADRRFVDLPGYGYAKVPDRIKQQIEALLNEYLGQRQCLQGLILLMDIRHPLSVVDKQMIDFSYQQNLPLHILLTKCDKLSRGASQNTLIQVRKEISAYPNVSVQTFSAHQRLGLQEVLSKLDQWFNFATNEGT